MVSRFSRFSRVAVLAALPLGLSLTSCKGDDDDNPITPSPSITAEVVRNLAPQPVSATALAIKAAADIDASSTPSSTGAPVPPKHYTFYSLAEQAVVPFADSATNRWDIAFKGTTVILNGGVSGPGQAAGQVLTQTFADVTTAPTANWTQDAAAGKAIPTGSGNGWYSYDPATHLIAPIAGRTIALKTATGQFAKLEILSYYQGAPTAPDPLTMPGGFFTFRYVLQTDGSANLVTTSTTSGPPAAPKHYTFYSLETKQEISFADSATTKWDIAFKGTTILTNAGTSGPGQGGAQVVAGLFDELNSAPETGYNIDAATGKAIPTGSGNGWYAYNAATHIIAPIAGRVLMIKTASGKYAKLEVVSYYKDAPATPDPLTVPSGYYTFRFVYQPNGSRLF